VKLLALLDLFVSEALAEAGQAYLWGGKGGHVWHPVQGLALSPWPERGYDCAGLVTVALRDVGGPDWRATHSAQTLWDQLEPAAADAPPFGALLFYGRSEAQVTHVAVGLGRQHARLGHLVVEASGGDSTTTSPAAARARGARVRVGYSARRDYRGARWLAVPHT
jgi:murein DD-endopeptidase